MITLGIDPGRESGAAVLLSAADEVRAWWTWRRLKRKGGEVWRVSQAVAPLARRGTFHHPPRSLEWSAPFHKEKEHEAMWQVGRGIATGSSRVSNVISKGTGYGGDPFIGSLVVEGLFAPRRKRGGRPVSPQSVIPLAEATGELIGGLRMTPALRPLASDWRPNQLGLPPRTPAEQAEAYAVEMAAHAFAWPEGAKAPTKAERGALAEAAFIARYGWVRLAAAAPAGRVRKPDG